MIAVHGRVAACSRYDGLFAVNYLQIYRSFCCWKIFKIYEHFVKLLEKLLIVSRALFALLKGADIFRCHVNDRQQLFVFVML